MSNIFFKDFNVDYALNKQPAIYSITNLINNKKYIGSAVNIYDRARTHKKDLKKNKHINLHLQSAFNKYGKDNFIFEILQFVCNSENLESLEQGWINIYKSNNRDLGYNKRKVSGSNLGIKMSKNSREKMSIAKKGKLPHNVRSVVQLIPYTFEFINKFISAKDASIKTNIIHISCVCSNDRNFAGGYYWMWEDEYKKNKDNILDYFLKNYSNKCNKPVKQIDIETNRIIKIWPGSAIARKILNIKTSISDAANGNRKTVGGFKWEWVNG